MIALIDADVVAYRAAASCNPTRAKPFQEPLEDAIKRADELMLRIMQDTGAEDYRAFLTGSSNFRFELFPEYKAGRPEKPIYLQDVREFLVTEWKAVVTDGYEADDAISMLAYGDFVICSNDKDLRQIPGQHYNFTTQTFFEINPIEAEYNFWCQMLVGDRVDGVRGIDGIGVVKASRLLMDQLPEDMEQIVREHYGDEQDRFYLNFQLLRLLRHENGFPEKQGTALTTECSEEDFRNLSSLPHRE